MSRCETQSTFVGKCLEKVDMNVIRNLLNKLPGGVFIQAAQINAWQVRITIIFTVMIAEYLKETIVQLVTFYLMPNMEIISFLKHNFCVS